MGTRLLGKVALITGAGSGMGRAHAERMDSEGATVYAADIDHAQAAATVETLSARSRALLLDVTDPVSWQSAVDVVATEHRRLDILVNNAGVLLTMSLEETSIEQWEATMRVNLTGPFLGMRVSLPLLRASGAASVINVSSPAGLQGRAGMTAYSSSKFGLRGLTQSAALELARDRVRVNSIHPGTVRTPMLRGADEHQLAARIPLGRIGEPADIASLVLFLASDESSYITGSEFIADGGRHAGPVSI